MTPKALWAALPVVLLVVVAFLFIRERPLDHLGAGVPPLETLTVERVTLDEAGIAVQVRAGSPEPLQIAQVQVDGAYRVFVQTPPGRLGRLDAARLDIPYPWVEGEAHHLTFVTSTGATFDHTIEIAHATPQRTASDLLAFGLVGLFVGVVPVGLGLLFYPALRSIGTGGLQFLLALTVGLLVFLLIDTLAEGLELAEGAADPFQADALVWLGALVAFALLMFVGRRGGRRPEGAALATFIALGIGLHNLGEGLAIGAAFAAGEAALASFLVLGFTLHNVTEGIGIAAPLVGRRPSLWTFIGLALLAGLPAVFGTWGGALAFSPHWAALCFGLGAGAILQVIVEVGAYLARRTRQPGTAWLSGSALAGLAVGLVAMYVTAMLTQA